MRAGSSATSTCRTPSCAEHAFLSATLLRDARARRARAQVMLWWRCTHSLSFHGEVQRAKVTCHSSSLDSSCGCSARAAHGSRSSGAARVWLIGCERAARARWETTTPRALYALPHSRVRTRRRRQQRMVGGSSRARVRGGGARKAPLAARVRGGVARVPRVLARIPRVPARIPRVLARIPL